MKNDNHNKTLRKIEFLGKVGMLCAVVFGFLSYYESSADLFNSALCFFLLGTLALSYAARVKVEAKKKTQNSKK
jgi:uncharacterized membrane protein